MKDREPTSKTFRAVAGASLVATWVSACARPVEIPYVPTETSPRTTEVFTPSETPLPTPTAEPTPTPEPSPTPTEVPMYIGLPADEVEVLQTRCLQDNPDSLCLVLPVSPVGQDLQLREVSEVTLDVDTSEGRLRIEDFYLELPLPFGATVRSLGDGEVRVFASHPASMGIWGDPVKAGRNLTKFDWLIFQHGPFQDDYPDLALVIRKADGSNFASEDLALKVGDRQDVSRYQSLVTVGGMDLVLRIYRYGPVSMFLGTPISESRVTLADLLRNDAGNVVYALPPIGEVWSEAEFYAYAEANCGSVSIGSGKDAIFSYADKLLERAGFPAESRENANLGTFLFRQCLVVYLHAPSGEQSFVFFENRNGEVQVIPTGPFDFWPAVSS